MTQASKTTKTLRKLDRKTCPLCVHEAAALRRKQREVEVSKAKQVIAQLSKAQRQVLDDGAEPSARRAGAGVGISGRQSSAAKLVELGLAELAGGRLWLTGVAQEALGLPRLQSDEVMRRIERQRRHLPGPRAGGRGRLPPLRGVGRGGGGT